MPARYEPDSCALGAVMGTVASVHRHLFLLVAMVRDVPLGGIWGHALVCAPGGMKCGCLTPRSSLESTNG
jgi:hypothetical protein